MRVGVSGVTIVVAPDGTAVLRGLPPGLFYVTVGMQGLEPVNVTVKIEGPRPDSVRVEFAPGR